MLISTAALRELVNRYTAMVTQFGWKPVGVTHPVQADNHLVTFASLVENSVQMQPIDHERFTQCWTQAHSAIAGYVTAVIGDAHAADDVLQDIALVLLRKFPDYDPARPFVAWAMGIAKMQILAQRRDQARSAERFSAQTVDALATTWEELLPQADERSRAMHRCLKQLMGRSRAMMMLRYREALSPAKIAERLGTTSGAVRTALTRLRTSLHECIQRRLSGNDFV